MSNAVTHRQKNGQVRAMIFGLLVIIIGTALVYAFGLWRSQWDNFAPGTNLKTIIHNNSSRYLASSFVSIIQVIVYIIFFNVIAGRSETEYSCIRVSGGNKYIYSGWTVSGIVSAIVVGVVALFVHYFAFQRHFDFVGPLMWWVLLLQMAVGISVFFLPFSKPLKKFGS